MGLLVGTGEASDVIYGQGAMPISSNKLQARLDLLVLPVAEGQAPAFGGDKAELSQALGLPIGTPAPGTTDSEGITVGGILPISFRQVRNHPSKADTLQITFDAAYLPIDFRAIAGMTVSLWVFAHQDGSAVTPGGPGYFGGIVDTISRDRYVSEVTLSCRDWTALPLGYQLNLGKLGPTKVKGFSIETLDIPALPFDSPDVLSGSISIARPVWRTVNTLDLDRPLWEVCQDLVRMAPGCEDWEVRPIGGLAKLGGGGANVGAAFGRASTHAFANYSVSEPPAAPATDYTDSSPQSLEPHVGAVNIEWQGDEPLPSLPAGGWDGPGIPFTDAVPKDARLANNQTHRNIPVYEIKPGKIYKTVVKATRIAQVLGTGAMSVWDAVSRLCAAMGFIPEVITQASGKPLVVIMDAEEFQTSDVLRPFERNGRRWRVMADGYNISKLEDARELHAGPKIQGVQISSIHPDTGEVLTGAYGLDTEEEGTGKSRRPAGKIIQEVAHGITSKSHLAKLARAAYYAIRKNDLTVDVGTHDVWSVGGSNNDPDLLDLAPGALIELMFPNTDRYHADDGSTPSQVLRKMGLPSAAAERLAAVLQRLRAQGLLTLRFQAAKVTYTYAAEQGTLDIDMELKTFLNDGAPLQLNPQDTPEDTEYE